MNPTGCGAAVMSSRLCENDVPCSVQGGLQDDDTPLLQINILAAIAPPIRIDNTKITSLTIVIVVLW